MHNNDIIYIYTADGVNEVEFSEYQLESDRLVYLPGESNDKVFPSELFHTCHILGYFRKDNHTHTHTHTHGFLPLIHTWHAYYECMVNVSMFPSKFVNKHSENMCTELYIGLRM